MLRHTLWLGILLLAGCSAIQPARMQVPESLGANPQSIEFRGFSGWNTGRFEAGPYSGTFRQTGGRTDVFDTVIERYALARFAVRGPEITSAIEGRCGMDEQALSLGDGVEMTTAPMAYRCEFTADGRPIPARFELQEVTGRGTAAYRYERIGEIALGGEVVRIRSAHDLTRTRIGTITPIGYVFERRGRAVGALELNGRPVLHMAQGTDPGLARTLIVAALALSVFSDPAEISFDADGA
ncbi:hypothetical protein [Qipengyuania sp. JC766]|uniref:hypothetical protein n=1 Tax=Qipengyuania sp. JC766 TaxID=3232139 RepID=UPI00345A7906